MGYILIALGITLVITFTWFHISAKPKKGSNLVLIILGIGIAVTGFIIHYNENYTNKGENETTTVAKQKESIIEESISPTDFTEDDVEYVRQMMNTSEKILANFNEFQNLMVASDIGTESWTNQVNGNLNLRKQYINDFKDLNLKTNALRHSDEYLLEAFDKYYLVAEELPVAIKNQDADRIGELTEITNEANALITKASDEVRLVTRRESVKLDEIN